MPSLIIRFLASVFIVALASCDSVDTFFVDAGVDQTVQPGTSVALVGTADSPDGSIVSYEWVQISSEEIELTDSNTSSASFTAPDVEADIVLTFQLIVIDSRGGRVTDNVNVYVTALLSSPDQTANLELEPNNSIAEADLLTLGNAVSGQVANVADQDWFEIDLLSGTNYRIEFIGADKDAIYIGTYGYWGISVYDSGNNLLASTVAGDKDLEMSNINLDIGIGSTGKYYVVIDSFTNVELTHTTESYAFSVITSPISNVEVESNDTLSTSDVLTIGVPVTGQVSNGSDQDWYSFSATSGTNYQIQFESSDDIIGLLSSDWLLSVYDFSNNLLGSTTIDGSYQTTATSASLNIAVSATGMHYIVVQSQYPSLKALNQSYAVKVNIL